MQQLVGMLQLSVEEIGEVVAVATTIFQQAAAFGDGVQSAVLAAEGVDSDVVAIIEKLWRKKGRPLAEALEHAMPLDPAASLKQSQWQLQVELANRHLGKQSEPLAVFQLQIADDDSTVRSDLFMRSVPSNSLMARNAQEKVDIEMKHGELLAFFQQLNSIQKALDETAEAAAP
jgi:hypothetical protein